VVAPEAKAELEASAEGLSQAEVKKRLAQYGFNELPEKKVNPVLKFLSSFWGPIAWMIEAAAILSAIVKHWEDFAIIGLLLVGNAVVGFWEEYQAGNAIAALKAQLALEARVKRDGAWTTVPARELVPGDLIRLDIGCRYLHYFADTARTLVVGEASPTQRKAYAAIRAGVQAACERIRPGTRVSELFDVCMGTIRKSGLPDYERHHCGHSIGLEMYEPPMVVGGGRSSDIFARGLDRPLEPGMIVNIEAPLYHLGFGGMNVEDTLLVTATGAEWLTLLDREMVVV
jgi:hypothetical protein